MGEPNDADPSGDPSATTALPAEASWWTPERAELFRWLERNAPGLAPVYRAATQMALDDGFPGRVWFVAHAVREIRNRLPDALAGEVAAIRTDYADLATEVYARWIEDGLPVDGVATVDAPTEASTTDLGRREVSSELFKAVAMLVAGHLAATDNNESKARRLFEAVGGQPPPAYAVRGWLQGTKWATAYAHVRNKPLAKQDEDALVGRFLGFEHTLRAIANRSYENMDELDEILGRANS
jgi:hypothetical protein